MTDQQSITTGDVAPLAEPTGTQAVTCAACGNESQIMAPDPSTDHPETGEQVEIRWLCDDPSHGPGGYQNIVEGHIGELGEGTLNPAASALTDEQVLEAAVRRGLVVGGSASPAGEAAVTTTEGEPQP